MFKKSSKLFAHHLLQKVGGAKKLDFPEGYREKRKKVKEINPAILKSHKHVQAIQKSIRSEQKSLSSFSEFLRKESENELKFDPELAKILEMVSQTFGEIPKLQENIIQDFSQKYVEPSKKLMKDVDKSTELHNEFKVNLSEFHKLDKSNLVLRKKVKSANPQQQQVIIKKIQQNILQMEEDQEKLDETYHTTNCQIQKVLHDRKCDHISTLFDIINTFYTFFEDGIAMIDLVKPIIQKRMEEIKEENESYVDPPKLEKHGTWEIESYDPEDSKRKSKDSVKETETNKRDFPIGTCSAKFDFVPKEKDELPFKEGEKIFVLKKKDEDWSNGINESGQIGDFPNNYVTEIIPSEKTIALYPYDAADSSELTFKKGDEITVLHKAEDNWWIGCFVTSSGYEIGTFPCNYCELGKDLVINTSTEYLEEMNGEIE